MLTRSKRLIIIHIKDLIKAAIMKRVGTVGFIKKWCFLPTSLLTQHYVSLIKKTQTFNHFNKVGLLLSSSITFNLLERNSRVLERVANCLLKLAKLFQSKILKFTKFTMRQVCKVKKAFPYFILICAVALNLVSMRVERSSCPLLCRIENVRSLSHQPLPAFSVKPFISFI